jgi:hypothetical protein
VKRFAGDGQGVGMLTETSLVARSRRALLVMALSVTSCSGTIAGAGDDRPVGAGDDRPVDRGPAASPPATKPGQPSQAPAPAPAACSARVTDGYVRRMNRHELANVARDVLGIDSEAFRRLPAEQGLGGFLTVGSQLDVSGAFVDPLWDDVEALAEQAAAKLAAGCGQMTAADCVSTRLLPLARRLFRRALTPDEARRLLALVETAAQSSDPGGLGAGLGSLLMSPRFLFVGLGAGDGHPQSDVATRLALALWSSLPDEPLLAAAESNQLATDAGLAAQVDRMMADPRFGRFVQGFFDQWLMTAQLDAMTPDATHYKFATGGWEKLRASMREETTLFAGEVVKQGLSLATLLGADFTFVDETLAKHYGLASVSGAGLRRVSLPPAAKRRGLLTHGSVLTLTSHPEHTSVVKRGAAVLSNFLCQPPPPPPASLEALIAQVAAQADTPKAEAEARKRRAECSACHLRMDAIGLALEGFDVIGRLRTQDEKGRAVDTTAELDDVRIDGALPLVDVLVKSGRFSPCFVEVLMTYTLGRALDPATSQADKCAVDQIAGSLVGGRDNVAAAISAVMALLPGLGQ